MTNRYMKDPNNSMSSVDPASSGFRSLTSFVGGFFMGAAFGGTTVIAAVTGFSVAPVLLTGMVFTGFGAYIADAHLSEFLLGIMTGSSAGIFLVLNFSFAVESETSFALSPSP